MHVQISFCSAEQYEEDKRGFTFSDYIPKSKFFSLLSLFSMILEDHPHYHVKLRNKNGECFYLVFDLLNAKPKR